LTEDGLSSLAARLPAALNEKYVRWALLQPDSLFAGVGGLQVVSWTLLPLLVHHNAPLDVIEGAAWGREWLLGYAKGPPLFAWILGALDLLEDGPRLAAIYLISQLCIALTFFGVWRLGIRLLSRTEALLAVMLMQGVYYFTYPTPELNEIVLQMPISALLGWIFHRAITDGRRRDWILVGALAALGMWTRYSSAVLLLSLGAFLLLQPETRRHLRTEGPYVALATFVLLWSPHVFWIVQSDFQSIRYVAGRAMPLRAPLDHVVAAAKFALAQLLALLPALLMALLLRISRWRGDGAGSGHVRATDRIYIGVLALGPFAFAEARSLISGMGLRSMSGGPLWCFIGLLLVLGVGPVLSHLRLRRFAAAWGVVGALSLMAYAGVHGIGPEIKENEKRSSFPGDALADAVTARWQDATGKRLRFVVGETWLAGNVAFYSPDRPSTFIDANPAASPWIDPAELAATGAVLVWNADETGDVVPAELRQAFPSAVAQNPLVLRKRCIRVRNPVRIGWAIVPPA
jgi:hypothetical protein